MCRMLRKFITCFHRPFILRFAKPNTTELRISVRGLADQTKSDKISPKFFVETLQSAGFNFFTGVPDSLLKDFAAYVTQNVPKEKHVIAANEGNAVALALGYHLATGNCAVVYLQNSGLGNTVNPLISLCAPDVFSVPILLIIGWRGEPGVKDEPQHFVQGRITQNLLRAMEIPFDVLPDNTEDALRCIFTAKKFVTEKNGPYALLVRSKMFSSYPLCKGNELGPLTREEALGLVISKIPNNCTIVCTTGMLSRELFEYRKNNNLDHNQDFLTIGGMGHASSIALGIALARPEKHVICLDGDGAALMHMGSLAIIGQMQPNNFKHIIFNNGAHDSVGGQPTSSSGEHFSFQTVALGCGYKQASRYSKKVDIVENIKKFFESPGPSLLELRIRTGNRKDLGRPTHTPLQNKISFKDNLQR